jgi:hypothetical protein
MATVWLTYNGKGLMSHAGYGLGWSASSPTPITSGKVRFKFDNTSITVQDLYANVFDSTKCTVTPVVDSVTGLQIPGLFDVAPGQYTSEFKTVYQTTGDATVLSIENCGGRVDVVDAYITGNGYYWPYAFGHSTAIRNITITHYESVAGETFSNFVDSSSAENIDLEYYGQGDLWSDSMGEASLNTMTVRNFTSRIHSNTFNGLNIDTLNLYPANSQPVFSTPTNGTFWPTIMNIYTHQAPGTSYAFMTSGAMLHIFESKGVEELNAFAEDGTRIALLLPADCSYLFRDCPIKDLTKFPLDCTNLTNATGMFGYCNWVETGIIDTYNVLSAKLTGSSGHAGTFRNCGSSTTTGSAELAQIPSDWK